MALFWGRVLFLGPPPHERLCRQRLGHVASVFRQPPFGGVANLPTESPGRHAFDEAVVDQLPERPGDGVLVEMAQARGVAGGQGDATVVRAVLSAGQLDIDYARVGPQFLPG